MPQDDIVAAMEVEILPSTSNGEPKSKEREKDSKSPSLPWYILFFFSKRNFVLLTIGSIE